MDKFEKTIFTILLVCVLCSLAGALSALTTDVRGLVLDSLTAPACHKQCPLPESNR